MDRSDSGSEDRAVVNPPQLDREQKSLAWEAVVEALNECRPDWLDSPKKPADCAVSAIRHLASACWVAPSVEQGPAGHDEWHHIARHVGTVEGDNYWFTYDEMESFRRRLVLPDPPPYGWRKVLKDLLIYAEIHGPHNNQVGGVIPDEIGAALVLLHGDDFP